MLDLPDLADQLDVICEFCSEFAPESTVALYGWGCRLETPELWREMPTPTSALRGFIRASVERGVYELGESDLFLQDEAKSFEFLLCHESDLHFKTEVEEWLQRVESRWQAAGLRPVRVSAEP